MTLCIHFRPVLNLLSLYSLQVPSFPGRLSFSPLLVYKPCPGRYVHHVCPARVILHLAFIAKFSSHTPFSFPRCPCDRFSYFFFCSVSGFPPPMRKVASSFTSLPPFAAPILPPYSSFLHSGVTLMGFFFFYHCFVLFLSLTLRSCAHCMFFVS